MEGVLRWRWVAPLGVQAVTREVRRSVLRADASARGFTPPATMCLASKQLGASRRSRSGCLDGIRSGTSKSSFAIIQKESRTTTCTRAGSINGTATATATTTAAPRTAKRASARPVPPSQPSSARPSLPHQWPHLQANDARNLLDPSLAPHHPQSLPPSSSSPPARAPSPQPTPPRQHPQAQALWPTPHPALAASVARMSTRAGSAAAAASLAATASMATGGAAMAAAAAVAIAGPSSSGSRTFPVARGHVSGVAMPRLPALHPTPEDPAPFPSWAPANGAHLGAVATHAAAASAAAAAEEPPANQLRPPQPSRPPPQHPQLLPMRHIVAAVDPDLNGALAVIFWDEYPTLGSGSGPGPDQEAERTGAGASGCSGDSAQQAGLQASGAAAGGRNGGGTAWPSPLLDGRLLTGRVAPGGRGRGEGRAEGVTESSGAAGGLRESVTGNGVIEAGAAEEAEARAAAAAAADASGLWEGGWAAGGDENAEEEEEIDGDGWGLPRAPPPPPDPSRWSVHVWDMPTSAAQLQKLTASGRASKRRLLNVAGARRVLGNALRIALPAPPQPVALYGYVEVPPIVPKDGSLAAYTSLWGTSAWLGLLAASGFTVGSTPVRRWKTDLGLYGARSKDAGLALARRLFPEQQDILSRKKDHGRGDALLIAAWGLGACLPPRLAATLKRSRMTLDEFITEHPVVGLAWGPPRPPLMKDAYGNVLTPERDVIDEIESAQSKVDRKEAARVSRAAKKAAPRERRVRCGPRQRRRASGTGAAGAEVSSAGEAPDVVTASDGESLDQIAGVKAEKAKTKRAAKKASKNAEEGDGDGDSGAVSAAVGEDVGDAAAGAVAALKPAKKKKKKKKKTKRRGKASAAGTGGDEATRDSATAAAAVGQPVESDTAGGESEAPAKRSKGRGRKVLGSEAGAEVAVEAVAAAAPSEAKKTRKRSSTRTAAAPELDALGGALLTASQDNGLVREGQGGARGEEAHVTATAEAPVKGTRRRGQIMGKQAVAGEGPAVAAEEAGAQAAAEVEEEAMVEASIPAKPKNARGRKAAAEVAWEVADAGLAGVTAGREGAAQGGEPPRQRKRGKGQSVR